LDFQSRHWPVVRSPTPSSHHNVTRENAGPDPDFQYLTNRGQGNTRHPTHSIEIPCEPVPPWHCEYPHVRPRSEEQFIGAACAVPEIPKVMPATIVLTTAMLLA
jgi:hypothetical protein